MRTRQPPAPPIRVLVVEDSRFMRSVIGGILASDPSIEVVGAVSDGREAVEAVASLRPDVVTMDVEMPHVDGLAAVDRIMSEFPTPVLMLSATTRRGSNAAIRALELGAVDFIAKPSSSVDIGLEALRQEIVAKVHMAARVRPIRTMAHRNGNGLASAHALAGVPAPRTTRIAPPRPDRPLLEWTPCVVIAASTGGPAALLGLIPALPGDLPASVVIAQHMPPPYTAAFAQQLDVRSALTVVEAVDGDGLKRGVVYVCPGGWHLTVSSGGGIALRPRDRGGIECPSADLAMTSAAGCAGRLTVGMVLTGMGRDGAVGARAIRQAGGVVVAQDEASSVVYGMPRAALEFAGVDAVVPLSGLASTLITLVEDMAGVEWRASGAV